MNSPIKFYSISGNIHMIDFNIISKLEQDLEPDEVISLVFLLYEESHVGLQQVKLLERVARSAASGRGTRPCMDLLLNWALKVQSTKPMWKYELLEALCICQLYSNIRKLEFDVSEVKKHFVPGNVHLSIYTHPMKKVLYKICEGLTSHKLQKLKLCLETFNIICDDADIAEITFLQLICEQFISLGYWESSKSSTSSNQKTCKIVELAHILKGIGCNEFAEDLREAQNRINGGTIDEFVSHAASPNITQNVDRRESEGDMDLNDLETRFAKLLEEEGNSLPKIKTDATKEAKDVYKIKDPNNVGICYIINQVKFHPSKESIRQGIKQLEDRIGSDKDREALNATFTKLGFTVYIDHDLSHNFIKDNIRQIISNKTTDRHSVFVLCILSHGMKGAIFGVDSVPIKVSDIQDIMCEEQATNLLGIPKILLIQACQGTEGARAVKKWVTDGPKAKVRYIPAKSDLLTYWATVPDHLSYRSEDHGTVFIQLLCTILQKSNGKDHLQDLFTKVTGYITHNCVNAPQVPIFETTWGKKVYLSQK